MHKRLAKEFARIELNYQITEPIKISDLKTHRDRLQKLSEYGKIRKNLDEETIYNLFKEFKYIVPQGSIMSQLGSKSIGSLSNCFVIGQPEDSYGGIFQKDEEMAQLMKRRGGVGIDISTLRPIGTPTSNAAKSSTGAVSFMHRFSNTTREVAQNGRRGALMISIDINHPDVMEFIKIKRDLSQVTGANISIKINNEFMKAVEADEDYLLRFPCNSNTEDLLYPDETIEYNKLYKCSHIKSRDVVYTRKIKAKEYWNEIIKSAHGVAEPGIIFIDNHHDYSPDGAYPQFKGVTTNPCGEIFMQPYDACRLIALNLYSFVKNPFTKDAEFDSEKFYRITYEAMRLSDDLIDLEIEHIDRILNKLNSDPESNEVKWTEIELWNKIKQTAQASRRTGLGFTAEGDMLAALGMKYDSDKALLFIEQIKYLKMEAELDCTIDLAILRGTFEGWDRNIEFTEEFELVGNNKFYQMLVSEFPNQVSRMIKYGRRNVSWSTVAPTGTVSLLTQTTSGIEPLFMPFYMRRKKVNPNDKDVRVDFTDQNGDTWQEFPVLHPKFRVWAEHHTETLGIENYTNEALQELFEQSPWYGSTANDIDWIKRVEMQSIIQKYTTHSISSTINLPNNVSEEEVSKIYLESWKKGLKGITVYRDGSRSGVLVSTETNANRDTFEYVDAVKRPKVLEAEVHLTKVAGKPYYVVVGMMDNKPYEVFINNSELPLGKGEVVKKNKSAYEFRNNDYHQIISSNMTDEQLAITRLTSGMLRHGADIKFIVEQLNKCDGDLFSFTKGLARVLKKFIPDGAKSTVKCHDCGSENVIFEEGCNKCLDCGSSKCG
jgi:ribonucleoside-diphosphate reductase alpha chain